MIKQSRMQVFYRVLPILIVIIALTARFLPGTRTIDDAYITYRYSQNVLEGHGLVYNPGERVLGTTTPLYAGLLALSGLVFGGARAPFPGISLVINTIADALTCLLLINIGRKLNVRWAGVSAALAWAVLPYSVTFAIGGLETSVFVLILTGLITLYLEQNYTLTALLAALSLLTRPDAALLLLPLGLDRLFLAIRKGVRIHWPEAAAFALPLVFWIAPAALFYGSPIPNSIAAKTSAYNLPAEAAFIRFLQHYATPFMDNLTFGSAGIAIGLVGYFFLNLTGGLRLIRENYRSWSWVVFPWLWFAAYSIANPLVFRWYLTPPLPSFIFTLLAGVEFVRRDITAGRLKSLAGPVILLMLIGPSLLVLRGWTWDPDHGPRTPAPDMAWIQLELKYQEAADYLSSIMEQPEDTVLAAGDIGALGYYTDARILDTLGLISPEAIPYYPTQPEYYVNAYAVSPDLINDLQPDFVVLLEVYGREGLFKNDDFNAAYDLIHTVETDIYDSHGMLIFSKK